MSAETLTAVPLSTVKAGELFKRKPDAKTVFVRNHYDRATKSFSASDFDDINREVFIKANKMVFIGFTF